MAPHTCKKWFSILMTALLVVTFVTPFSGYQSVSAAQQKPPVQFALADIKPQPIPFMDDPGAAPYHFDPPAQLLAANSTGTSVEIHYVPAGGTNFLGDSCVTFPENARVAFDAAAQMWANLLVSSVPITIEACWADLPAGVLGHSAPTQLYLNYDNGLLYPQALANALNGAPMLSEFDDMSIAYANGYTSTFYYGTDGHPPSYQTDFMSVVAHEIAHGLGFLGSMSVSNSVGRWGYNGYPIIYDNYAIGGSGNYLLDTSVYPNYSTQLAAALTSSVYFAGPHAMSANGGSPVRLYTPATWSPGSSYSHLNYTTYSGTPNSLMVYAIGKGSSIHDPGPVGLGVLLDVGWTTAPAVVLPGDFNKSGPANGSTGVSIYPTLSWGSSSNATGYQYCYDTSNNNTCNTTWLDASGTSVTLSSALANDTTYYWQVRATNSDGSTEANFSTWWTFTTQSAPKWYYSYIPYIDTPTPPYSGRITDNGAPVAGQPVYILYSQDGGNTLEVVDYTFSRSDGTFSFFGTPVVNTSSQMFFVYWQGSKDNLKWLMNYGCRLVTYTDKRYTCDMNIHNIVKSAPKDGSHVNSPATFRWIRRSTSTDSYIFRLYDGGGNGAKVAEIKGLGYIDNVSIRFWGYYTNYKYVWNLDLLSSDGGAGSGNGGWNIYFNNMGGSAPAGAEGTVLDQAEASQQPQGLLDPVVRLQKAWDLLNK